MKSLKLLLAALVMATAFLVAGSISLAQSGAPATGNMAVRDGINPGEVVVSWDAVPGATHYRIGYVNMVTDYPLAKASVTGDWINAFIYVDENARNVQVPNGRAEYTVRRLEQDARHAFTVLTSSNFVDTGSAGTVSSEFSWTSNPRWKFHTVADRGGAAAPGPSFDFVSMYPNCDAVRAHYPGGVGSDSPVYRPALDPDGDGVACEPASTAPVTDLSSRYPGCDAVREHHPGGVVRGSPIYRADLDSDGDGIACEPISRTSPIPYGQRFQAGVLDMQITAVDNDAWPEIQAENRFNNPPPDGKLFLMWTLNVWNIRGSHNENESINDFDFKLIGNQEILYRPFVSGVRCGIIPNELRGQLFREDAVTGTICFAVPIGEIGSGLTLRYEKDQSTDDSTGNVSVWFDALPN